MQTTRNRCAVLAVALALLSFPAAAPAQGGAGDSQYQDPFAGEGGGQSGGGGGGGSGGGGSGGAGQSSNSGQMSSSPPGSSSQSGSGRIPRTGADPGLIALLGAGLVMTGAGLRVRLRRPVG